MPTIVTASGKGEALRGLYRLAGAVLVQAIEDLRSTSRQNRDDAGRWILDNNGGRFSFVYCCRLLGREPDQVRFSLMPQQVPALSLSYIEFMRLRSSLHGASAYADMPVSPRRAA